MPHPIMLFKKTLKLTDITRRLAIPTKSLEFFPDFNGGHFLCLNVLYEGRVWPMVCSTRKQGLKKPVLSKGWIPFLRGNHLNVGDVVALYKEEDEAGLQYRMEVDRATRIPNPKSNEVGAEGPSVSHRAIPKQEWKGNYSSKSAISYIQSTWDATDNTFSPLPAQFMPESFSSHLLPTLPSKLYHVDPSLLQELDLSNTNIKTLPESLPNLVALQKLILKCCDLFMELSPQVGELPNLEELDLNDTEILGLPQEIRKLSKLKYLRVAFYGYMNCGKRLRQNALIQPGTISALSRLTELSIDVNSDDERWNAVVEAVIEEACSLETLKCLILYLPNIESLGKHRMGSTSLGYYPLQEFRFTIGQHKQRTISRVPKQVETHFQKWKRCLKFVKGKEIPSEMKKVLKCTKAFYLDRHDTATSLCDFGTENMQELEFCLLVECNEIQTIISGVEPLEEQADVLVKDPNNSESGGGLLSAQEPALVNLQYLHIFYLKNLVSIWRTPTNDKQCLTGLKFLALHMCPKLSVIFSPAMLANLGKLEVLIVKDCPEVTSIVSLTSNEPFDTSFCLPNLNRILLLHLPKLISISGGIFITGNLKQIGFYNCPKLESLSIKEMSSPLLEVIRGEREWWEALKWEKLEWEKLEWEKLEWETSLDYIRSIFSPITMEKDVMTQMEEISRIPSSHQTRMIDPLYCWMESAGKSPLDSSLDASVMTSLWTDESSVSVGSASEIADIGLDKMSLGCEDDGMSLGCEDNGMSLGCEDNGLNKMSLGCFSLSDN
ncbi:hypothetical protein SLEP1_g40742 [Rubroshorea leprosula]|uniref:TF-B3 domain-containing protein n=1 Tax=Rubroshorea leprosula TaxID=152421 RepID=A0AAV5L4C9_9ROSI|nr:hypothetical protein SLEP1_g40742 [Rubroshorea leprosula]